MAWRSRASLAAFAAAACADALREFQPAGRFDVVPAPAPFDTFDTFEGEVRAPDCGFAAVVRCRPCPAGFPPERSMTAALPALRPEISVSRDRGGGDAGSI